MIHIIHISDGEKHFSEAVSEYVKRMAKNIEIHTIRPIKHTEIAYIKREETKKLIEKITKLKGTVILCDERGETMDTIAFAEILRKGRNESENLIFIIGGSYGVDIDILRATGPIRLLQLSGLVMPHGLAYLVLIEQIYRGLEIIKGSGYHHN
ncbi:23S rRNA (pseudouridine(1915)-N(3))-methyltransferase RlmH [Candidatus Gracilibacteria bacterium]|nr:23S rRNA (pseudouridine(1915)-N(3))-methyltransferase RlmH [Candidatus Gracilibacteria bacterium]